MKHFKLNTIRTVVYQFKILMQIFKTVMFVCVFVCATFLKLKKDIATIKLQHTFEDIKTFSFLRIMDLDTDISS